MVRSVFDYCQKRISARVSPLSAQFNFTGYLFYLDQKSLALQRCKEEFSESQPIELIEAGIGQLQPSALLLRAQAGWYIPGEVHIHHAQRRRG
jgi:hypothetical protein